MKKESNTFDTKVKGQSQFGSKSFFSSLPKYKARDRGKLLNILKKQTLSQGFDKISNNHKK